MFDLYSFVAGIILGAQLIVMILSAPSLLFPNKGLPRIDPKDMPKMPRVKPPKRWPRV